ncbi:MAG: hypothetical protein Q8T08_18805, partial [Ignavibacteria bacterium]|nr:hypothetical protein [Ignavibacteria bacterium]
MRKIFLVFGFIGLTTILFAQIEPYYSSRTLKKAFSNQSRSPLGIPAANYWQNSSTYQIVAELQVGKPSISGKASITYSNNSPDTLDKLVFNLYQDIYKKGNSRDWDIGDA